MQSMQNLSQQQLIMSMKEYLALVAWPGVQPSFLGGGEAPEAQDTHAQAAEGTPEVEEAIEDTPEAKEASGATEADVDDDYVADITAALGTWDPWPTPAQD